MAVTYVFAGSLQINSGAQVTFSGDQTGIPQTAFNSTITFAATGGTAPVIAGFVKASVNASTVSTNILLAHATNILTNFSGTAVYSDGFTVAGQKVKELIIINNDATNNITVGTPSANSFPIIAATNQSLAVLHPGGLFVFYDPTGFPSGGLTTGTNDAISVISSAGTPNFTVMVKYGLT
jgi:hypothetical protein